MIVAWCETRQAFRHFRTDRISAIETMTERYPRRRLALIKEWRELEGIGEA
jgi:predicted DNA-binding transcriptional regulator YafY